MKSPVCKRYDITVYGNAREELFLDSKSGAFRLEDSRLRNVDAIKRLYLIAAVAILYATTQGLTVQIIGLRTTVDPHWRRGLSYLKIGLRCLDSLNRRGTRRARVAIFGV